MCDQELSWFKIDDWLNSRASTNYSIRVLISDRRLCPGQAGLGCLLWYCQEMIGSKAASAWYGLFVAAILVTGPTSASSAVKTEPTKDAASRLQRVQLANAVLLRHHNELINDVV